jgi:parvulin-like peptidyl-prolyl isomerase
MHGKSPTFLGASAPRIALTLACALLLAACAPGGDTTAPADPGAPVIEGAPGSSPADATLAPDNTAPEEGTPSIADVPDPVEGAVGDFAATVNGQSIPMGDFRAQAFSAMTYHVQQGLDPNSDDGRAQLLALRRQVLDDMINQALIGQYADAHGITTTDDELQQRLQVYVDQLGGQDAFEKYLTDARTTRDQVLAMEREELIGTKVIDQVVGDIPTTAVHLHARHILCDTKAECDAALARLNAGEDFAAVAKDVSHDDTTKDSGGDLQWIARGMLPGQKFEDALFSLKPGERSGVVESEFGFHIIEVLEEDDQRELSPEQQFDLREKKFLEWVSEQRASADIQILIPDLAPAQG